MVKERSYSATKRNVTTYEMKQVRFRITEKQNLALKAHCKKNKLSVQQLLEEFVKQITQEE